MVQASFGSAVKSFSCLLYAAVALSATGNAHAKIEKLGCPVWKCSIKADTSKWTASKRKIGNGGTLTLHPKETPGAAEVFLTLRPRSPGENTPLDAFESDRKRIALIYGNFQLRDSSTVLLAGLPCHEALFMAGGKLFLRYTTQAGPYTILLGMSADPKNFEEYEPEFRKIAASFQVPREVLAGQRQSPFSTSGKPAIRTIAPVYSWPLNGKLVVSPEIEVSGGDTGLALQGVRIALRNRNGRALSFKWVEADELAYRLVSFDPLGTRIGCTTAVPARGRAVILLPRQEVPQGLLEKGGYLEVELVSSGTRARKRLRTRLKPTSPAFENVLSFPLKGVWRVVRGPWDGDVLRRSLTFAGDRFHLCHRFALELVKVDSRGERPRKAARNTDYPAFGAEIRSPADARVIETYDELPDNSPGTESRKPKLGNTILLKLHGSPNYLLLAHLASGSIRVKPGDAVKQGQVLALVGNSGMSSEPHLRMEIYSGREPYCDGIPMIFENVSIPSTSGWNKLKNTCLDAGWIVKSE